MAIGVSRPRHRGRHRQTHVHRACRSTAAWSRNRSALRNHCIGLASACCRCGYKIATVEHAFKLSAGNPPRAAPRASADFSALPKASRSTGEQRRLRYRQSAAALVKGQAGDLAVILVDHSRCRLGPGRIEAPVRGSAGMERHLADADIATGVTITLFEGPSRAGSWLGTPGRCASTSSPRNGGDWPGADRR